MFFPGDPSSPRVLHKGEALPDVESVQMTTARGEAECVVVIRFRPLAGEVSGGQEPPG
jgi:hypothetical protein